MKKLLVVCLVPLALAGCLSFSSSEPPRTTVVVPSNATITCSDGQVGPC